MRTGWSVALSLALGLLLISCSSGSSPGGLYPKAVSAADEISAIQNLRSIATAQAQLRAARGNFGDFDALVQAGFLDQRFSGTQPNLRGYRFTMKVNDSDFAVNADPHATESQPTTGARFFYLDSSDNAVHVNSGQPASRTDPTL
ncbi:MAG: hypothetical protein AABM67_03875 [Acidobacteriota bacterium]